jgi:hypothetical protein
MSFQHLRRKNKMMEFLAYYAAAYLSIGLIIMILIAKWNGD